LGAWTTSRTRAAEPIIAGVDAQTRSTRLGRLDRALIVEMNVRHDRTGECRTISASAAVDSSSGHDTRTISAPRRPRLDLRDGRRSVAGQSVGHGLDADRSRRRRPKHCQP